MLNCSSSLPPGRHQGKEPIGRAMVLNRHHLAKLWWGRMFKSFKVIRISGHSWRRGLEPPFAWAGVGFSARKFPIRAANERKYEVCLLNPHHYTPIKSINNSQISVLCVSPMNHICILLIKVNKAKKEPERKRCTNYDKEKWHIHSEKSNLRP